MFWTWDKKAFSHGHFFSWEFESQSSKLEELSRIATRHITRHHTSSKFRKKGCFKKYVLKSSKRKEATRLLFEGPILYLVFHHILCNVYPVALDRTRRQTLLISLWLWVWQKRILAPSLNVFRGCKFYEKNFLLFFS